MRLPSGWRSMDSSCCSVRCLSVPMCWSFSASHCLSYALPVVWWWLRLAGRSSRQELGNQRTAEAAQGSDGDAFYPLTMLLTVGPGAISVAIALGSQRPKAGRRFRSSCDARRGSHCRPAAVAATTYICYRFAEPTIAALGNHGTNVVVRLSAFLLLCIGIQIAWTGLSELQAPSIPPH